MTESGLIFGLPLLTKDLIEQAARRRTYVLRTIYTVVLYTAALWVYADISGGGIRSGLTNLGRGRELFQLLVKVQFAAIIILLPAFCCGAITAEKERDTLGLLLITKLTPTTIVLEKLLSRLVSMATYQLPSLPLFAVVYGMGGVELVEILATIWSLACFSAVVGAYSIYCSSWHRTTSGAFIAAYLMMPVLTIFATVFLGGMMAGLSELWHPHGPMTGSRLAISIFVSAFLLAVITGTMIGMVWLSVAMAQQQLLSRAFLSPRNLLLEFFKKLDRFFEELNEKTTRGVMLVNDRDSGPLFQPIAWRETQKKSLGTVRYLFRLLVVLEVPLIFSISWTITDMRGSFDGPTAFFLSMLWPIAAITIVVHATNVLASERSRQTLDVLLVAPLTQANLVDQKLAGVRRLIGILTVPFATLTIFQAIWTLYVVRGLEVFARGSVEGHVFLHEILGMTLALIIYPRLIQWIAFHLALRIKNQTTAVLTSLAMVIAVCVVPLLMDGLEFYGVPLELRGMMAWISPVRVLFHRWFLRRYINPTYSSMFESTDDQFLGLAAHAIVFGVMWYILRRTARNGFSRIVGRTEPGECS